MRPSLKQFALVATLMSAAACSEPLAPESVLGTYELTTLVAPAESETHRFELLSSTVTIDPEHVTRTVRIVETQLATGAVFIREHSMPMLYTIDGARIVTRMMPCPVGMACTAVGISTPDYRVLPDGLVELGSQGQAFARVSAQPD
jgi:hypothetical protein